MSVSLALGPALPPALDSHIKRTASEGAAPVPAVKLNTSVPGLGPYHMDLGGAYTLTVYAGPMMAFRATPTLGTQVDTTA